MTHSESKTIDIWATFALLNHNLLSTLSFCTNFIMDDYNIIIIFLKSHNLIKIQDNTNNRLN